MWDVRLISIVMGLLLLCGGASGAELNDQVKAVPGRVKVVEDFMTLMVERQLVNSAMRSKLAEIDREMLAMLAPYFFEILGVDPGTFAINKYSPDGFRVIAEHGDYVMVKLLRKNSAWPTLIAFKTAEYRGRFVIEPASINLFGKSDPSLVTPWFYAAEQHDVMVETLPLPTIDKPSRVVPAAASRERLREEGVALVKTLIAYLDKRCKLGGEARRTVFVNEIRPLLARAYTDLYGVDLGYYEDIVVDQITNCKIAGIVDDYVVLDCAESLYDRYSFKLVMEEGRVKILPTGIDNSRRTISPVWQRE